MEKIIIMILLLFVSVHGENLTSDFETTCLACHKKQQIPNTLIYRRYLMKYSTSERIEKAMIQYMLAPDKVHSIMPPQFFLKFPMKEALPLDEKDLKIYVNTFIKKYDVKQYLILEK